MKPRGIIKTTVHAAHSREHGKERGEWMKLTDTEAQLIRSMRELRERQAA